MQVDWLSGFIEAPPQFCPHYPVGRYLRLGPDGDVLDEWAAREVVRDEASSSRVFTVGASTPGKLHLSGNPVKLLQGHNAFGSCDAFALFLEAGAFVRERAGLFPSPATWDSCQFSGPRFTRVDLTRSYRFRSESEAHAWVRAVAGSARDRRGSAKLRGDSTASFGIGSKRWQFVVYCKLDEMVREAKKAGAGPYGIPREVLDWAAGVVRFELRLRSNELARCAEFVSGLRGSSASRVALDLWSEYFNRITFNGNAAMAERDLIEETLPVHLRLKLEAWRAGADLRGILSRPSFYRVRRALLSAVGVDIASPPPSAVGADGDVAAGLDPAGWDPEPVAAHYVEPREELSRQYRLT